MKSIFYSILYTILSKTHLLTQLLLLWARVTVLQLQSNLPLPPPDPASCLLPSSQPTGGTSSEQPQSACPAVQGGQGQLATAVQHGTPRSLWDINQEADIHSLTEQ